MLNWLVYKKNNDLPEDIATDLVAGFVDKEDAEIFILIMEKAEDDPRYTYYIKSKTEPGSVLDASKIA